MGTSWRRHGPTINHRGDTMEAPWTHDGPNMEAPWTNHAPTTDVGPWCLRRESVGVHGASMVGPW